MEKIKKIGECKEKLMGWLCEELGCGKENYLKNFEAIGELVDEIKDLAESEEKCMKSFYYEQIIQAMEESKEKGSYGYDNWRYSSGRFAPTGKGHYAGYRPDMYRYDDLEEDDMLTEFKMGYSDGSRKGGSGSDRSGGGRRVNASGESYGFMPSMMNSERGIWYDQYQDAKRHYHESGTPEAKKEMDDKMSHNITELVSQLKEMNEDASPEMQKELKMKVSKVMDDMNRMI